VWVREGLFGFSDGSRPGTCPKLPPGTVGYCADLCRDWSCPRGQKCCSNSCGCTCQTAV
uniref:WAP domain-containing protein n=1 Tax=Equus asinus TaxID=9793 RepID=A0A8C4LYQ8_EQUAS